MSFVLVEPLGSKGVDHTLWFKQMTAIGPMTTPERTERTEFATEQDARACSAMWHALSCFEIEEAA